MFSTPGWLRGDTPAGGDRSRSPPRAAAPLSNTLTQAVGDRSAIFPITEIKSADEWMDKNVDDPDVLTGFMELPLIKRQEIVLKAMKTPPKTANAWFMACVRNHRTNILVKEERQKASVHNRPLPPVRQEGPPIGVLSSEARTGRDRFAAVSPSPSIRSDAMMQDPHGAHTPHSAFVPAWSAMLLSHWPNQKSQLVSEFMSLLDVETLTLVQTLPPQTLAAMAFTLAVAGTSATSAGTQVANWCHRYSSKDQPRSNDASSPPSQSSQETPVTIQFVMLAPDKVTAHIFLKVFLHAVEKLASSRVSFLPMIVVSPTAELFKSSSSHAQRHRVEVNSSVTTKETLSNFMTTNKGKFRENNIKTMMVTLVRADALQASTVSSPNTAAALHSDAFRDMWAMVNCCEELRAEVGDGNVAELVLTPSSITSEQQEKMEKLIGARVNTSQSQYGGVASTPAVFACPRNVCVVQCMSEHSESDTTENWNLTGQPKVSSSIVSGGVAKTIGRLTEMRVFGERPLTAAEDEFLESFMETHSQTGEVRLAPRQAWLRWWNLGKSPLQQICDDEFPCFGHILTVTGSRCDPSSPSARMCGRDRYCRHCQTVLETLGALYNLHAVVDVLLGVMTKSLQAWRSSSGSPELWQRDHDPSRQHVCRPGCVGV